MIIFSPHSLSDTWHSCSFLSSPKDSTSFCPLLNVSLRAPALVWSLGVDLRAPSGTTTTSFSLFSLYLPLMQFYFFISTFTTTIMGNGTVKIEETDTHKYFKHQQWKAVTQKPPSCCFLAQQFIWRAVDVHNSAVCLQTKTVFYNKHTDSSSLLQNVSTWRSMGFYVKQQMP